MNKHPLLIATSGVVLGGIIGFGLFFSNKTEAPERIFKDENIGITFEQPENLKPFAPKHMSFAECAECPYLLSVESEYVDTEDTLEEILERNKYSEQTIIGTTTIDGVPAFITKFKNTDGASDEKYVYAIKNNALYAIHARDIDLEHVLRTIVFMKPKN